jgi:tight adherence protein B
MSVLFLGMVIFILCLFVIELTAYAVRIIQHPDRAEIRKRLRRIGAVESDNEESPNIIKKTVLSDVPFLNQLLSSLPGVDRLELLMRQANVKYTMSFFILLSFALGIMGYLFFLILTKNPISPLLLAIAAAILPFLSLRSKKKKRIAKFEKQLPEGLGMIARALRAGHAFTSGMRLASEEFSDPLGPEFGETLDEINFGISVPEALKNLALRVDCPDLRFFVVSVILQRETGGNLAEIIENLAHLIRERFKFKGKVRVLSAEGRFSAFILLLLPFVLFLAIYLLNREYVSHLIVDPIGRLMLGLAALMMFIGLLVIRRIIKVEV